MFAIIDSELAVACLAGLKVFMGVDSVGFLSQAIIASSILLFPPRTCPGWLGRCFVDS